MEIISYTSIQLDDKVEQTVWAALWHKIIENLSDKIEGENHGRYLPMDQDLRRIKTRIKFDVADRIHLPLNFKTIVKNHKLQTKELL